MVCRLAGTAMIGLVYALAACEPTREVSTWPLRLRNVGSCKIGEPSALELLALGDFPSRRYAVRTGEPEPALDDLPVELREVLVRATTPLGVAEGRRIHATSEPEALWMLQAGTSCPLADTGLSALDGRAVAVLPEGGALLVGGAEPELLATKSQALLLVEGQEYAVDVEGGMLLRRAYASATAVRELVLVAGGTPDRRAGAHDNFELFDRRMGRFVAAKSGKLRESRMQHAAVLLPDDKVLLIGGRREPDGEPLASLELIDVGTTTSEALTGSLQVPRAAPEALVLDSGSVWVLGGRDGAGQVLGSVEVFDQEQGDFTLAAPELPVHEQVAVAALPGARAAWLSCDHAPRGGGARCELVLIREYAGELQVVPVPLRFEAEVPNGLTDLRLLYAGHGKLLWTGADDSDPTGRRRAFTIDPVAAELVRVEASRVPAQLQRLPSGLIAELDGFGMSVRASFTGGRYDSPEGNLLTEAAANLVLDAPGHWSLQDDELQALEAGARLDLAELRFAGFEANMRVRGDYTLHVYDGAGHNAALSVRASTVVLPGCRYQLRGDMDLQLVRAGSRLTVSGTSCAITVADAALGIALELEKGAVVRSVTIQRH